MERNGVIRKSDWICNLVPIWFKFDEPVGLCKCNESGTQLLRACTPSFIEMICLFLLYSRGGNHDPDTLFWSKGEIWSLSLFSRLHTNNGIRFFSFPYSCSNKGSCKSDLILYYIHKLFCRDLHNEGCHIINLLLYWQNMMKCWRYVSAESTLRKERWNDELSFYWYWLDYWDPHI